MKRPNILFVMVDEQKANSLGCYGNEQVVTPNLDRLAREGVRFENGYVQNPICVASRVNFFAGQYSHTTNAHSNVKFLDIEKQPYLTKLLQENGYETSFFGKNHLLKGDAVGYGFDEWCEFYGTNSTSKRRIMSEAFAAKVKEWRRPPHTVATVPEELAPEYPPVAICENVIDYLNERECAKPFFMWLSIREPHPPFYARRCDLDHYPEGQVTLYPNGLDTREGKPRLLEEVYKEWSLDTVTAEELTACVRHYYAMNTAIDEQIGRVIECLRAKGQLDDTLIVYTADHGDWVGEYGMVHKTSHFYDCLTKVPYIWHWPNGIKSGQAVKGLAQAVDFFPTVCELLGLATPEPVQGRSLVPLLDGSAEKVHDYVFSEAGFAETMQNPGWWPSFAFWYKGKMARSERFKYSCYQTGEEEFYDMDADPWEKRNLINDPAYAAEISEHRRQALLFEIRSEPPMPEFPQDGRKR